MLDFVCGKPTGEIGQLRDEELPVVRVIVPPDRSGRVFEDDLEPGDLVFDAKLTPMLVWHERYSVGRGWRSGWVLSYDTDGKGNLDDYIVGLGLPDVDAAVAQAREYLRSVGYLAAGWPFVPDDHRIGDRQGYPAAGDRDSRVPGRISRFNR